MSGRRVAAITRRILAQFRRDRRTMALLFVVPVFVTGLLGWIVTESQALPPRVSTVVLSPPFANRVEAAFYAADADGVIDYVAIVDTEEAVRRQLRDDEIDVALVVPAGIEADVLAGRRPTVTVITQGIDPAADAGAVVAVQRVVAGAIGTGPSGAVVPAFEHATVYGSPGATQLDALGPIFLGFFAYFFVFLLTGVSFLRERTGGTLERLLATPVAKAEIVVGYVAGFGILATIQVVVLLTFSLADVQVPALGPLPAFSLGLGVANAGNPLLVFAIVLLLAIGAVNLGIMLSTFARTELQVIQFIPIVIVPQAFLGGLIWPVESLHDALQPISRVLPLTYGIEGLRSVLVRGA
ncbi:MAG TPA: ABC transporter permease, partial [Candidatus Nanopelagicales bacterium]|nr:ABC transporter permease [Candidatus Nanopelagicales bacterium]